MKKLCIALWLAATAAFAQEPTHQRQTVSRGIAASSVSIVNSFTLQMMPSITCNPVSGSTTGDIQINCAWTTPTSGGLGVFDGTDLLTTIPGACSGANDALYMPTTTSVGCHNIAGGGGATISTDTFWGAKGDLAIATANDAAARHVAPSNGSIIVADTAQSDGWKNIPAATTAEITDISSSGTESAGTALGTYALGDHQHVLPVAARTFTQCFMPQDAAFSTASFPQLKIIAGTNFPVSALYFDGTNDENAYWNFRAFGYASGNITVTVDWYPDTGSTLAVGWTAAIAAVTPADAVDIETKAMGAEATVAATTVGGTQRVMRTTVSITSLDSIAADDEVWLKVGRRPGDAGDTMTAIDAAVTDVCISYLRTF